MKMGAEINQIALLSNRSPLPIGSRSFQVGSKLVNSHQTICPEMKRYALFLFVLTAMAVSAQPPDLSKVKLKSKASFTAAQPSVLLAADYVIANGPEAKGRADCEQFLLEWMDGTKDFTFEIDNSLIHNEDGVLLGVYLASVSRFVIQHRDSASNQKLIKLTSIRNIIKWCDDPQHNTSLPVYLEKYKKADAEGKLEELIQP
jgi:hypothetical protein